MAFAGTLGYFCANCFFFTTAAMLAKFVWVLIISGVRSFIRPQTHVSPLHVFLNFLHLQFFSQMHKETSMQITVWNINIM